MFPKPWEPNFPRADQNFGFIATGRAMAGMSMVLSDTWHVYCSFAPALWQQIFGQEQKGFMRVSLV
ncbi:MAG: hypothetical protein GY729_10290 [Desulfobacteraceae bacterium]|nr:hypothetical protein [Desulfobacteraceae bacterium]